MFYYFVVSVDTKKHHEEFFESNEQDALKYMAYKEQSIREVVNCFTSENNRVVVSSTYYSSDVINGINSEKVETLEKNLIHTTRLRGELIESFHKLK